MNAVNNSSAGRAWAHFEKEPCLYGGKKKCLPSAKSSQ